MLGSGSLARTLVRVVIWHGSSKGVTEVPCDVQLAGCRQIARNGGVNRSSLRKATKIQRGAQKHVASTTQTITELRKQVWSEQYERNVVCARLLLKEARNRVLQKSDVQYVLVH